MIERHVSFCKHTRKIDDIDLYDLFLSTAPKRGIGYLLQTLENLNELVLRQLKEDCSLQQTYAYVFLVLCVYPALVVQLHSNAQKERSALLSLVLSRCRLSRRMIWKHLKIGLYAFKDYNLSSSCALKVSQCQLRKRYKKVEICKRFQSASPHAHLTPFSLHITYVRAFSQSLVTHLWARNVLPANSNKQLPMYMSSIF